MSSSDEPLWSKAQLAVVGAFSAVYGVFSLVALFRACALFAASRRARHRFAAKKIFFIVLFTYFLLRVADGAFELGTPCWTVAGGYESWCMAADAALKRVAGMLFASCFFLMLCVWADFVSAFATSRRRASTTYLLATAGGAGAAAASLNSSTGDYGKSDLLRKMRLPLALLGSLAVGAIVVYITLFCMLRENVPLLLSIDTGFMFSLSVLTCLIGVGVAFFGVRITLLARRYNPSSRLYIKILSLALLCSLLLVFKAVMWMAVTARDENIGSRPLWRDIFNTVLTELIPAACMCAIFWPVPKPQARFPTSK